jgi:hypothetical protein
MPYIAHITLGVTPVGENDAYFFGKWYFVLYHKFTYILTLRVREKITSQFIELRFSSDLDYLNELNRKRNLSYTEDSVSEDRTKMV